MAIEFDECNISNNKTGVRAPATANVKFKKTNISGNEVGVDIAIAPELAEALSLPLDTPKIYLDEAERILVKNKDSDMISKLKLLEDSRLFKWLGHTSSFVTVATALISRFSN
ncbi:hypothetical protein AB7W67_07975 [Providencia rettgeri]|nr:hypothetical protein [Providencia rettgeri]